MNKQIKFVYFDVGEVMIKGATSKTLAEKTLGVNYEEFKKVYQKYSRLAYKGKIIAEELLEKYIQELQNVKIDDVKSFWNKWIESLSPMPETHDLIYELYGKYKIGILTNMYKGLLEKMRSKNLIPNIDYASVIDSSRVGFAKPEKEIYLIAQKQTGLLPENILFIDNRKEYVLAAKNLGWEGFVFDYQKPKRSIEEIEKTL